jgi:hypothetical protein
VTDNTRHSILCIACFLLSRGVCIPGQVGGSSGASICHLQVRCCRRAFAGRSSWRLGFVSSRLRAVAFVRCLVFLFAAFVRGACRLCALLFVVLQARSCSLRLHFVHFFLMHARYLISPGGVGASSFRVLGKLRVLFIFSVSFALYHAFLHAHVSRAFALHAAFVCMRFACFFF